jgi:hypothetical protein
VIFARVVYPMPESFSHTKELTAILRAAPEDAFPVAVYGYRASTDRTVAVAALSMPHAQRFLEKFALTVDVEMLARACFGYHVSEGDVAQPVAKVMTLQTQRDVELLGCREAHAPLTQLSLIVTSSAFGMALVAHEATARTLPIPLPWNLSTAETTCTMPERMILGDKSDITPCMWTAPHAMLPPTVAVPADVRDLFRFRGAQSAADEQYSEGIHCVGFQTNASQHATVSCTSLTESALAVLTAQARVTRASKRQDFVNWDLFQPSVLGVQAPIIALPARANAEVRKALHDVLLLPNQPQLHAANAIDTSGDLRSTAQLSVKAPQDVPMTVITTVHEQCEKLAMPKTIPNATTHVVSGAYDYYHYHVDRFDDGGWGCAYRSLQTLLSWFQHDGRYFSKSFKMPTLNEIQRILLSVDPEKAKMGEKFVGSKTWIGSFEVMMVLQHYVPLLECKIHRVEKGKQLDEDVQLHRLLAAHFDRGGAPVMIGGAAYAHTILGINCNIRTGDAQYLILDPHYTATTTDLRTVKSKGWCGWKDAAKFFKASEWYNMCLPAPYATDWR